MGWEPTEDRMVAAAPGADARGQAGRLAIPWTVLRPDGSAEGAGKETEMVTIGMNYRVLPGKEEVFETAFRKVLRALAGIEGHTNSKMFHEIDDPNHYVILSEWTDRTAFDGFIASEAFRAVAKWGKEEVLAGRPVHTCYEH